MRAIEHQRPLPRIIIMLGTTETSGTVSHVVSWDLLQMNKDWDTLPVGKSMPGRQCFLRDISSQQRITTYDLAGELCIAAGNEYKFFFSVLLKWY
jgi:hypothetical protein